MRAWTAEVGTPPRTYDWEPAIARLGGFPSAGAEKWEREHPRWPHHALVRGRFGSWRAALGAAGLPGAAPLRVPRRERVETARRLHGQLPEAEIAELIGVHPRTVRSYLRAGTCTRCGGVQIRPSMDANSCPDCIPYVAHTGPSRAAVLRAMR